MYNFDSSIYLFLKALPLCLALMACANISGASQSRPYTLARDGHAEVTIVTPQGSGRVLEAAALDLQQYIRKSAGAEPEIRNDTEPIEGLTLQLGNTRLAQAAGISFDGLRREGFVLTPAENTILISAPLEDGVAHGVYTFLRECMGVRWFRPGELWEEVPQANPLVVQVPEMRVSPSMDIRIWSGFGTSEGADWRNRIRLTRSSREIPNWGHGHNLVTLLPPSKYGKDHPEYYAEVNGRRWVPDKDNFPLAQPCFTHPDVIQIAIQHIRQFFEDNPTQTQFSLCTNDNIDFCTCTECSKLDLPEVYSIHGWRTHSDSYYYFVEQVAKEILKSNPDKTLGCYAYWGTDALPRNIKRLPDNVTILYTQDTSQHFDPEYRKRDRELYEGWHRVAKHVGRYDYYGLGWLTPRYFPTLAEQDLKYAHRMNTHGMYIECHPYLAFIGPQLYMAANLLWDINQSGEDLLNEYMTGLFAEAAPTMARFHQLMERIWTKERPGMWFQGLEWIPNEIPVFDAQAMAEGWNLLGQALEESSGASHQRIASIRKDYQLSYLISSGYETAMAIRDLPLNSADDIAPITQQMSRSAYLVHLAERSWESTFKVDPLHSHTYYMDAPRFWYKFGGWQDRITAEMMTGLIRQMEWAEANLGPDKAQEFMQPILDEVSKWEFRNRPDYTRRLIPQYHFSRAGSLTIDGDFSDWQSQPWHPIITDAGEEIASFAAAWDDEYFYFACQVTDTYHFQPEKEGNLWIADSVQIGLDTLRDASHTVTYSADDYEIGFALTPAGPDYWQWQPQMARPEGILLEVVHSNGKTRYEAAIPWDNLSPLKPEGGEIIGMAIVVNDHDGNTRTFHQWAGGMAMNKDPRYFLPVRFK